uniref:glutamate-rich protein 3 n=1 Tax=Euleptes europaea TaxID=460621 RepID=UPI002542045F|nr:glutamate-rich protein 3 [Euleptes europaea]
MDDIFELQLRNVMYYDASKGQTVNVDLTFQARTNGGHIAPSVCAFLMRNSGQVETRHYTQKQAAVRLNKVTPFSTYSFSPSLVNFNYQSLAERKMLQALEQSMVRFLANYNSLTDKHLAGYFSNTRRRRHLQRSGLISRSGKIISEKEYRLNTMKKDHQKYIRDCLAQAILHKVLDMERHHQVELKRRLENSVKKEHAQKIKVERSKRSAEDTNFLHSPHPPTAPKRHFGRHKLGDRGQSGHLAICPRPSTAPGNIQHPVRRQPLYSNELILKASSSSRPKFSTYETEHLFASEGERGLLRPMHSTDYSSGISPYQLPIINNYVIPVPPPPPKSEKTINVMKLVSSRGRRYRPTTAPNGLEQSLMKDAGKFYKSQVHTNAYVTMIYLGKSVHLCHDLFDCRDEIKIYQQHCGGENVCVYRGKVVEGDTFHFTSKRHHGFPFSLTFYLNGMQVSRLSSCCEYKHRKGTRLGGKHGHFGFVNVERSSPCYKCIIAMGLDKKPFPPKKKMTATEEKKKEYSRGPKVSYKQTEKSISTEENKDSVSMTSSLPEEEREFAGGSMEMDARRIKGARIKWERNLRSTSDYAYDEDFEADEEKSDEKVNEEGQADDQMNGMSKSPSDDEKDNLDCEKESKNSSQKALQASDSERGESDGYLESDLEEDKQDRKCVPSLSSSSMVYSSENDSDRETKKQEDDKDNSDIHSEYENETQRKEGQETSLEEEEDISEAENAIEKNWSSTPQESLEDTTLVRETLKHIGSVDMNTREDREEDVLVHLEGNIPEVEYRSKELSHPEDRGDCKSVKEKIAEAIEKDHLLSSEPEDSDSSTEEEENIICAQDKNEDGASLAEEPKTLESQKATVQKEQDKQMVGKERTLEKDKLLAEEGLKEVALEEELSARNVAALTVKWEVKNELQTEETELKKAAVVELGLEMDNTEKDIIYEEGESYEGKIQVEKLKETVLEDKACKRQEILEAYQIEREDLEGQKFTGGLMVNEEASDGEEFAEDLWETAAVLEGVEAIELVGRKSLEKEASGVKEVVEETIEADVVMGTAFVAGDTVGVAQKPIEEVESGAYETLKRSEHEEEHGDTIENGILEGSFLKGDEYANVELKSDSIMEAKFLAPESKEVDIITIYKKADFSEEPVPGGNGLVGEVSSDQEESEEEISQQVSKTKILSTNEDIALEKLGTWMEEPLLDWETERGISLTAEKIKKGHQAIVTTGREEKADKTNAEGDAKKETTVKGRLLAKEPTQEEENLMQAVEEEVEEELIEQVLKSEVAGSERKLVTKKEELFTEDTIEPEAIVMVAEEIVVNKQPEGEVDAEEADMEGEVVIKGEVEDGETKEGRKGVLKLKEETEEAGAEIEVGSKGKVQAEDTEMEREVSVKGKVDSEEAEVGGKVAHKGKVQAEDTEMEKEASVKEEVDVEEAEAGKKMILKGKVEDEEPEMEREVVLKVKMDAEEAEAGKKVAHKGKVQAGETEMEKEASVKEKEDAEEAEAGEKMILNGKGEDEEPEMEREVVVKVKRDAEEAEEKVVIKGQVEAEHLEARGEVSVDARSKGEIVSEVRGQSIEVVTAAMVTEAKQVSESSAEKLGAGEENQERRKGNEARLEDEVKISTEDALRDTSIDTLLQKEMVPVEDEEEAVEAGTKGERLRDEIPVKYVEEALLFGIQMSSEVSQISVEAMTDRFEDLEEEMSSHENTAREDIFMAVVEERQASQSDNSEEKETKELVEVIHLEKKDRSGKSQIKQEEFQIEKLPVTESFAMNTQHSESEQQQDISAQMICLEAHASSDLDNRN